MAPRKGSANTRVSPNLHGNNHAKSSNMIASRMQQLIGIIQGYEEKISTTLGMVVHKKQMFEENLENLEKENNLLKEKFAKNTTTKTTFLGKP